MKARRHFPKVGEEINPHVDAHRIA